MGPRTVIRNTFSSKRINIKTNNCETELITNPCMVREGRETDRQGDRQTERQTKRRGQTDTEAERTA